MASTVSDREKSIIISLAKAGVGTSVIAEAWGIPKQAVVELIVLNNDTLFTINAAILLGGEQIYTPKLMVAGELNEQVPIKLFKLPCVVFTHGVHVVVCLGDSPSMTPS